MAVPPLKPQTAPPIPALSPEETEFAGLVKQFHDACVATKRTSEQMIPVLISVVETLRNNDCLAHILDSQRIVFVGARQSEKLKMADKMEMTVQAQPSPRARINP